ncbi:hypothetical protein Glove_20g31 [Diversispora epigaea]|uniref:Uncharacterized protein n=1 Tax=Diversispora epigaea TaxID=1348612 RepID=A0A397JS98_9GLOM|nr:hypothetical protein Glove_20g31 [Diversispora epigaea]
MIRNYNEQYTANWWAKTEKTIPLGLHLLSIILYSDASTTDTLRKNTLHPIFITLGNIITWRRNKPDVKQLLAYLPIIKAKDDTQKKSEEHKNIVRRTFHKSLKFLLSPLYNEDNGIELNNRILWCIPRISMIISDWPEACTFSLTYKSTQSNHPCYFCLVSKENLSNINLNSNQIEPRSHKNMKLHYKNNTEKNESINEWAKLFIELFEEYSSSKLQFPKLHSWVFHICSSIREFGVINGYTTETYESLYKDYIRRKAIIIESSSKEIPKIPIALKYSKKLYEFCIQNVEIYIQTRMNDPDLEKEMKLGFEKFLKCLDAYLDFYDQKLSEHEEIDIKFRIYSGVTLKYDAKMRANNKFHKRSIFSNIAVEMNPDEIFNIHQIMVLLITKIIMNYEEPMHLALVQWYDFKSLVNPYLYKCPLLEKTNIFNLIEIEVINDIIHIIPRFNIDNEFLVNKFLF